MGIIFGLDDNSRIRNEKYQTVKEDVVENTDVCIIGSGAAGAVLAKELVEAGLRVVLLEKGGYYEGKDMNQRDADMLPLLWKNSGFNFDDNLKIAIAQGSCLGGSTIINDAVCFDPPQRVREEWKSMGVNFSDDEWSEHAKRVNQILSVSEVADTELNRNNLMLREGAEKLNFSDHRKNHRNCINCMQCGFCHLGCHYETKQNVLVTYLHRALAGEDSMLHIYCNCDANVISYTDGNSIQSTVNGVEGDFVGPDGVKSYRIRINSKIVITSAGTIASSKLLLQNGIAQKTAGRGLCLHPAPFMMGDFDYEIKGNQGIPMAYTVHDFGVTRTSDKTRKDWNFDDGGEFLIESIFLPILQFSISIPAGPGEHQQLLERFNNYAMAGLLIRDGNNGRVSLTPTGRTSITYDLGQKELKSMAKGMEILAKMWFALGAKQIVSSHRNLMILKNEKDIPKLVDKVLNDHKNLLLGSAHPQSGNRIGPSPDISVVDSDCKVYGFKNLFVCDASVFPTAVGVNPQVTIMTVASIIASRIKRDWNAKYATIQITNNNLGKTGSLLQPMYLLKSNLSDLFDSIQTKFGASMLVNSASNMPDDTNWSIDLNTLEITNNTHWKGIYPRDHDLENLINIYAGGFWKRFSKSGTEIDGITHPFEATGVNAKNRPIDTKLEGFGNVILLEYTEPPYDRFYDVLKFADENTILGKAFSAKPVPGREMMTFSMTRKYPFEFMTEDDHEILYSKSVKPALKDMVGIWEGYLVSDSTWSDVVFKFRYYFDDSTLKNDYLFGGVLLGTATALDKDDHLEMHDLTGQMFHDEIRQVNSDTMIGRYYSEENSLARWLENGPSFIHLDKGRSSFYLPYILKRIGKESAYKIW